VSGDLFATRSRRVPVMAILRGFGVQESVALCHRAWDLGIELVEIPIQTPTAVQALRAAARAAAERGAIVGAGTVVSTGLVDTALRAGAAFTVAPGLDPQVLAASRDAGLPHLPGVGTASEVHRALGLGVGWLKAFPAEQLGATWPRALHGPFPEARFVATGGVTPANAQEYLDGGASIVALGSALADPAQFAKLATWLETRQDGT
jgi:Entner-Doudoroff aldolase